MKKMLFTVISLLCFMTVRAQNSTLTTEELEFRNEIEQFLKEEGYIPTIDDNDNSVNFKKEGDRYWIEVNDASPTYVEFSKSGFTTKDSNMAILSEVCNRANSEIRCGKACLSGTSVLMTVEFYCQDTNDFRYVFYKSMNALDALEKKLLEVYKELDK